ncbi:MAG: DUF362 domain-containing protein [Firmicutes bacterium]|nr:DUF362 domain-containing protein [Bacillota bacterium]
MQSVKPRVYITRCSRYHYDEMRLSLIKLLDPFGGINALVSSGQKVLLKPNLLAAASPAEAVTTHPLVVKIMADLVTEAGGKVYIGDSPGSDSQDKAHQAAGYRQVMDETGAEMLLLNEVKEKKSHGNRVRVIPLAAELDRVDLIINLAKLKTHSLTGMTAAVKNVYGCVPGNHKKRFHMEHPLPLDFSKLVVDICLAVKPAFSIIDAVVSMEGVGPRRGKPRQTGLLLASENPFALDTVAAEIFGFMAEQVSTIAAARALNLTGSVLEDINLEGLLVDDYRIKDFDRGVVAAGKVSKLITNFPLAWLRNMRYARRPYPVLDRDLCTGCGVCAENCPLQIISFEGLIPDIDHHECIRCYCCQELCAEGAIKL